MFIDEVTMLLTCLVLYPTHSILYFVIFIAFEAASISLAINEINYYKLLVGNHRAGNDCGRHTKIIIGQSGVRGMEQDKIGHVKCILRYICICKSRTTNYRDFQSIDTQPTNIWHTFTNIQRWEKYASYAAGQIPTKPPKKHTPQPSNSFGMLAQSYGHL